MNNTNLILILLSGIILLKIFWLYTEVKFSKSRVNATMLKTNLIEAVILALTALQAIYFPLPSTPFDQLILLSGVIMYATGAILALWARLTMNNVWGIPGQHAAKQNALITSGPFQFSRNPIYLGFLLIYFGFAIAIVSYFVLLRIPLLIYFYKSARTEEKILEKNFGKKYLSYKSKTPLFLLWF